MTLSCHEARLILHGQQALFLEYERRANERARYDSKDYAYDLVARRMIRARHSM